VIELRVTAHDISKSFYSAWDLESAAIVKSRKQSVLQSLILSTAVKKEATDYNIGQF